MKFGLFFIPAEAVLRWKVLIKVMSVIQQGICMPFKFTIIIKGFVNLFNIKSPTVENKNQTETNYLSKYFRSALKVQSFSFQQNIFSLGTSWNSGWDYLRCLLDCIRIFNSWIGVL